MSFNFLRPWGMVGRGFGAWVDTWTSRGTAGQLHVGSVWRGVASPRGLATCYNFFFQLL
ncbi:hypothetical protein Hanom_Chr10g00902491 [Helianthus anomalus]